MMAALWDDSQEQSQELTEDDTYEMHEDVLVALPDLEETQITQNANEIVSCY